MIFEEILLGKQRLLVLPENWQHLVVLESSRLWKAQVCFGAPPGEVCERSITAVVCGVGHAAAEVSFESL